MMEPQPNPEKPVLFDRLLIVAGSLGPLGHCPASGTVTVALVGVPLYWVTHTLPLTLYIPALGVFTLVSIWLHQRGDRILGSKDSGVLVWDELVGFLIAVIGVPFSWKTVLLAFVLERVLDIAKVWPARWVEDHCPGGWGVVGDDVVAGVYTLAIMHLALHFMPTIFT